MKPGHDAAIAVLDGHRLTSYVESEKDSFKRHRALTAENFLTIAEQLGEVPDVFALGGFGDDTDRPIGSGFLGLDEITTRRTRMFGKDVTFFSSSHERSHLMMAVGMAPAEDVPEEAVLIYEGFIGTFVHVNHRAGATRRIPVLNSPGGRYALIWSIANPAVPRGAGPRHYEAGKLMALAAYGDPKAADDEIRGIVDRLLDPAAILNKQQFRDTRLYNAGVESDICKITAALFTERTFELFAAAAERELPAGLPLRISGGCGLNCDWNSMWRDRGHFSSVFVPPCVNDSGSALGTAVDALAQMTSGDPHIEWDVYQGLSFDNDIDPDPATWTRRPRAAEPLAAAIGEGRIVAWVEGQWEIGPRALGHRSLLAEPFSKATADRLNFIKKREAYRPIAPVCRLEDAGLAFHQDFPDPYMLYFRTVRSPDLRAVTHVDGSARAQTVTADSNPALHQLLTAFSRQNGIGVLCNTSLNVAGCGFMNRMSDLTRFCDERGIDDFVVNDTWYQRRLEHSG
jgi:hydroxymethyl cephem carbamoyltransferase